MNGMARILGRLRSQIPKTSTAEPLIPEWIIQDWMKDASELSTAADEPGFSEQLVGLSIRMASAGAPYSISGTTADQLEVQIRDRLGPGSAAARLGRLAVLHTDRAELAPINADLADPAIERWPPQTLMWTAPSARDGTSSWSIWESATGDANRHRFRMVFDPTPDLDPTLIYDDLQSFDTDVARHGSVRGLLSHLDRSGHNVMGFTWNLVYAAELSVLAGRRPRGQPPAHLGVECLLWWRRPSASPQKIIPDGQGPR